MQFNLITEVERQRIRHSRRYRLTMTTAIVELLLAAVLIGGGYICSGQVAQQMQVYDADYRLIQEQINKINKVERDKKTHAGKLQDLLKNQVHWPMLLVELAETKPSDVSVDSIKVQNETMRIAGTVRQRNSVPKWQSTLRKNGMFADVSLSKLDTDKKGAIQYEIEMRTNVEQDRGHAKTK